jgi:hypothetical protein
VQWIVKKVDLMERVEIRWGHVAARTWTTDAAMQLERYDPPVDAVAWLLASLEVKP